MNKEQKLDELREERAQLQNSISRYMLMRDNAPALAVSRRLEYRKKIKEAEKEIDRLQREIDELKNEE